MKKKKNNKSKVGFWNKLRVAIDESPWHSAFTYPIAFIILTIIVASIISYINTSISVSLVLFIYLTPLWVLYGLIVSKRRLPYLLSLIIGIALPATIGVIAYNGYTESAKRAAAKASHIKIVNYISTEVKKCSKGEKKYMGSTQNCPATTLKTINGTISTVNDKNPFDHNNLSARSSNSNTNDKDVGYVSLSASGSNIIIKTCIKTPCKNKVNQLQNSVSIK